MIIEWADSNGILVADKYAESFIQYRYDSGEKLLRVSTNTMLQAARVLHKEKKIVVDYILFKEQRIAINDDGRLSCWPEGCGDTYDLLLDRMLDWK